MIQTIINKLIECQANLATGKHQYLNDDINFILKLVRNQLTDGVTKLNNTIEELENEIYELKKSNNYYFDKYNQS